MKLLPCLLALAVLFAASARAEPRTDAPPKLSFVFEETVLLGATLTPGATAMGKRFIVPITGGHFEGYQVLHWPAGAEGKGVLMAGDQPQICMDPKQVSFMWSYPNYIPLNASTIRHVMQCLDPLEFDRIYGAFVVRGGRVVEMTFITNPARLGTLELTDL